MKMKMGERNSRFNYLYLARVAPPALAIVSFSLILTGSALWQGKTFWYVIGAAAFMTGIAYSVQVARRLGWVAPFLAAIWFGIVAISVTKIV